MIAERLMPRCLGCGYALGGLPGRSVCPECGRGYDLDDDGTYTTKPPYVALRFWAPALWLSLGTAMVVTVMVTAMLGSTIGGWTMTAVVGTPTVLGVLIGYRHRSGVFLLVLLSMVAAAGFVVGVLSLQVAGLFCGLVLGGIVFGPIFVGTVLGVWLRLGLKNTRFGQREYLPVILLALLFGSAWAEGPVGPQRVETVRTSAVLEASADDAWNAVVFYEDVTHPAPVLLRVGLPRPVRTIGASQTAGDVKRCIYTHGHLTKRITRAERGVRLEFEVVEQELMKQDVRLVGGSFEFEPLGPNATRVTLVTRYEPLILPRVLWRPVERLVVHTLHRHVLEGMQRNVEGVLHTALADAGGG